ncbi:MAG: ABC transporter permease [Alphaproteobacteria bacterium 41-28]|nr:MAG: ABC transporter permease [Alphaproteobacteria bacterium 41-28]
MINYISGIWDARYFWVHLSLSDLRSRWRRSFFGIFWSMIQPLGITLLISFVFSRLFNTDITRYAPHVLSGIIIWEFLVASVTGGALSFLQADAYIKQCKHPLAIYPLRTVLAALMMLMMASVPLIGWILFIMPENLGLCWISALLAFPILLLIAWPLSTFMAYIGVRFRDLVPALTLILQALWFVSPVYFEVKMFRAAGLDNFVDYNPIYHLLQIIRAPLLQGEWPTVENYSFCLITAIVFLILAIWLGSRAERRVIFYL